MGAESSIEKKAVAYAKSQGFLCFKFTCPGQQGVPDRLFISWQGISLFLEFKAPGKKPTPLQLRMLQKLRDQGVAAGWVDNFVTASAMLSMMNTFPYKFNKAYPL
jgi:hypothetical protein